MMRLSTLRKVDSTVDEEGSSPLARRILDNWAYDSGSLRFFRSSANFVYLFRKDGERHFLRFACSSERETSAIQAEVELLNWLAGEGLNSPVPVRSRSGNFVETITGDVGTFHAVVFVGLHGAQLEIEELDTAQFEEWGAALGKLHSVMSRYAGPGLDVRPTWRDHLLAAEKYVPPGEAGLRQELNQIASSLEALPLTRDNYGLIHSDFELDNLCWRSGNIGMLDFDGFSQGWYAADIAFALRDLFEEGANLNSSSFHKFVRGYSSHYALHNEMLLQIPTFLRMADLLTYGTLARTLDLPSGQEYPQWLEELNQKLRNRMRLYKASLERP